MDAVRPFPNDETSNNDVRTHGSYLVGGRPLCQSETSSPL